MLAIVTSHAIDMRKGSR